MSGDRQQGLNTAAPHPSSRRARDRSARWLRCKEEGPEPGPSQLAELDGIEMLRTSWAKSITSGRTALTQS